MAHTIGIDFGTTKTLVSYQDPQNSQPCFVRLGRGIDKMPTTIYVDEDGVWQFGEDADDFMSQDPARYRRDFKLGLGKTSPCMIARVKGSIQKFTAKDLTAKFLEHIKKQCEDTVFHESVSSCVITHPVAFSIAQRAELEEAAREAGFEEIALLPEPEAAGYAYYRFGADRSVSPLMVVDWGGGTVDFAMINCTEDEVVLVPDSYGGEVDVGGRKFDECLFEHLSRKIAQSGGGRLDDDAGILALNKQVRDYKERLSRVTSLKQIRLIGESQIYRADIERNEFNDSILSVVEAVISRLRYLISHCQMKPQALLLIGGSSVIPLIQERLENEIGVPCLEWDKLNEAVAIGGAWYGGKIFGTITESEEQIRNENDNDQATSTVNFHIDVVKEADPSAAQIKSKHQNERQVFRKRLVSKRDAVRQSSTNVEGGSNGSATVHAETYSVANFLLSMLCFILLGFFVDLIPGRASRSGMFKPLASFFILGAWLSRECSLEDTIAKIYLIVLAVVGLVQVVRRLHDLNMSGAWILVTAGIFYLCVEIGIGPVGGIAFLITIIVLFAKRGTIGPNRFGPDPLEQGVNETSETQNQ